MVIYSRSFHHLLIHHRRAILDEVIGRFGLYNGSNGHGGGFSSGVLLVFFCVLLCYRTPEEHQKERQKNPEGEEHQPPLINSDIVPNLPR